MFNLETILMYAFLIAYVAVLIIIAVKDKKHLKIDKKVLTVGVLISMGYMVYLYAVRAVSIKWNIFYLSIYAILLLIDTFLLRKYAKDSYLVKVFMLLNMILVFVDTQMTIYTMMIAGLATLIYVFLLSLDQKKNGNKKVKIEEVPIGYFIASSNVIALFIITFIRNWVA